MAKAPIVNFVSRQIAEAFDPGTGGFTHLISVSDPDVEPCLRSGWTAVLPLRFHDLNPGDFPDAKFPYAVLPTAAHCAQILEFAQACLLRGESVLVHCEAGVSRSGAVALALESLGFELFNRKRANCANSLMVQLFNGMLVKPITVPEDRFSEGGIALW